MFKIDENYSDYYEKDKTKLKESVLYEKFQN